MKTFNYFLYLFLIISAFTAHNLVARIAPEYAGDIIASEISDLKKDYSKVYDGGGSVYAPLELTNFTVNIKEAEQALKSGDLETASHKTSIAKHHLNSAIEKTYEELNQRQQKQSIFDNASFGISLTYGFSETINHNAGFKTDPGYIAGASLIVEKMFSNRFGIHSGLGYIQYELPITEAFFISPGSFDWHIKAISMPLMLITSFNSENFSINLLAGFNFYHIFYSVIKNDGSFPQPSVDATSYTTTNPVMAAAGMNIKIRVSNYVDIFFGGIGEISAQNIFKESSDPTSRYLNLRGMTGVMFRTDNFPIKK